MGPLSGIRVIEVSSIGPGPFCGMMLADMGADVLAIDRGGLEPPSPQDPLQRSRHRMTLDLKTVEARDALLALVDSADVLFEGFRPGVAEKLGVGPDVCLSRNPKLVYGRMTGWGQSGPLAAAPGHDINYIALSGALHAIGRAGEKPTPPLNLVGDFGGGGMLLAFGIVCALLEAQRTGRGQVVDAAMIDGAAALMAMFIGMQHSGAPVDRVGEHFLSGGAHYYDTYETKDGRYVAVGALEPKFYAALIERAGLDVEQFAEAGLFGPKGRDPQVWRTLKGDLAAIFRTRTRDEWCALLEGSDACVAPVLTLSEAPEHPHNRARGVFVNVAGAVQNAPAPRFSYSSTNAPRPSVVGREHVEALLKRWACSPETIRTVLSASRAERT